MSTALRNLVYAHIITLTVATGETVTEGYGVVHHTDAEHITNQGAASDLGIGIALNSGTAGERIQVALYGPVVGVIVGTGGATFGKKAIMKADGFADGTTHNSDGTGNENIYGIFMETGIATNKVGMMMIVGNRGV